VAINLTFIFISFFSKLGKGSSADRTERLNLHKKIDTSTSGAQALIYLQALIAAPPQNGAIRKLRDPKGAPPKSAIFRMRAKAWRLLVRLVL
jgi:hypothetical protein